MQKQHDGGRMDETVFFLDGLWYLILLDGVALCIALSKNSNVSAFMKAPSAIEGRRHLQTRWMRIGLLDNSLRLL
jgi:hypothetical protein